MTLTASPDLTSCPWFSSCQEPAVALAETAQQLDQALSTDSAAGAELTGPTSN